MATRQDEEIVVRLKNEREALAMLLETLLRMERRLSELNKNLVQFASMVEDNI